ncbi:hypothetical protein K505DRAFT_198731, partial [Melanomma pulvis-pyrius CBS 109.77]
PSTTPSSTAPIIIGYILSDPKKFTCSEPSCSSMKFGRLADLRRHHNVQHTDASNRMDYTCPIPECTRNAKGRKKGFGPRRDKRDEHVRNVHGSRRK